MLRALSFALLASTLALPAGLAQDHQEGQHAFAAEGMEVVHPWSRAAAPGETAFVFFELHNQGEADRLLGATTDLAEAIHIVGLAIGADGTAVEEVGPIDIPTGKFAFDPGGLALELHGFAGPLEQGGQFELVLTFANAGAVEIEVAVEAADADQHSHAGHSH